MPSDPKNILYSNYKPTSDILWESSRGIVTVVISLRQAVFSTFLKPIITGCRELNNYRVSRTKYLQGVENLIITGC